MSARFDELIDKVLSHEGGYVSDPDDPGGETNFGISKRSYPNEDIRGLTRARAVEIYKADYYDAIRGDDYGYSIRLAHLVFDTAVNSGVRTAIMFLQETLNAVSDLRPDLITDGLIGRKTLARLRSASLDQDASVHDYMRRRIMFYIRICERREVSIKYLRGWVGRTLDVALGE